MFLFVPPAVADYADDADDDHDAADDDELDDDGDAGFGHDDHTR